MFEVTSEFLSSEIKWRTQFKIWTCSTYEKYEKWLSEDTTILPRKFRIPEIRGEPEEQKTIRANIWPSNEFEEKFGGYACERRTARKRSSTLMKKWTRSWRIKQAAGSWNTGKPLEIELRERGKAVVGYIEEERNLATGLRQKIW